MSPITTPLEASPCPPTAQSLADRPELWGEPRSADALMVSEHTYWIQYYRKPDLRYEWHNGRLEEEPASDDKTFLVCNWLRDLLRLFLRTQPIGWMAAPGMGFRLPLPDGTVIRRPQIGVVRNDNPQPLLPLDTSYHGVYDLCVEALSDQERSGITHETVTKQAEYAAAGVSEYYILHREPERQAFFTRTTAGVYVPIAPQDGVIRSRVLPGLQFRLRDLIARPAPEALHDDPVYAGFVLADWPPEQEQQQARQADLEP
ncbi:Uma2 family endonuclease [Lamprocystis purpurea]|jgi:Uma2 family endonuclease|uniref:Uma2 family endonuclease n=1 Tax=Lamprocystis purpurea TaxID=61598 RepID=UPI000399C397|nr:Uma2 family endonuclease [Lamprocystis purpurea]